MPPPAFVEEVLRFDSPVQLTSRVGYDTKRGRRAGVEGAGRWSRCSARATGIRGGSPTRTSSTRCARTAGRSASAAARTSASVPRWPGSKAAVAFPRLLNRFPQIAAAGEPVRRDRLVLRGFDTLPVTVA